MNPRSTREFVRAGRPGTVLAVPVGVGDEVGCGDVVAVVRTGTDGVETVTTAEAGVVAAVDVRCGQPVRTHQAVVRLALGTRAARGGREPDSAAIAFLGPEGTFTHEALGLFAPSARQVPCGSVGAALQAVVDGHVTGALVPIENSVEGGVTATVDALCAEPGLRVEGEQILPVRFVLAARPGTSVAAVRAVGTHPHAWAQVRRFMSTNLPAAQHVSLPSTAAGAQRLAAGSSDIDATVCTRRAAERHGLVVLASDVGDHRTAETRFVLVTRGGPVPAPTGHDKTSVVVYQREDHAGGLAEVLIEFASRGVNLTRVESRPTGGGMESYCFAIDLEGHVAEPRVAESLMAVHRLARRVEFRGSYRRGYLSRRRPPAERFSDEDFDAARSWLRSIDGRVDARSSP